MAGYSGTPLVRKLGIKPPGLAAFVNAPAGFEATLGPLPDGVKTARPGDDGLDVAVLFCRDRAALEDGFRPLSGRLKPAGALWVAWPKKSSKVATDLTEDVVRAFGLEVGLVDVKVCAIDEVWSGLKFVVRLADRPRRT